MDDPWTRQLGEPPKWFARFEEYRLAGPNRTIEAVFRKSNTGKTRRPGVEWYEMSKRWDWKERAAAWDQSERDRVRRENMQAVEDFRKRKAAFGRKLQTKAWEKLGALKLEEMTAADLLKYVISGLEMEENAITAVTPDGAADDSDQTHVYLPEVDGDDDDVNGDEGDAGVAEGDAGVADGVGGDSVPA